MLDFGQSLELHHDYKRHKYNQWYVTGVDLSFTLINLCTSGSLSIHWIVSANNFLMQWVFICINNISRNVTHYSVHLCAGYWPARHSPASADTQRRRLAFQAEVWLVLTVRQVYAVQAAPGSGSGYHWLVKSLQKRISRWHKSLCYAWPMVEPLYWMS